MEHRNAPACKGRAVADPPYDEFRRVAERGEHRPRPDNGRRRGLGHRHDLDPARRKLARHLEVERPVAGDEHPRARGDPIGASQGLGRARRHDPGKGPAGNGMRPLVRPGGDDELTRAETARAAGGEDLDFRRCRVRIVASAGPADRVGAPHRGGADDLHPRGPHPLDEVGPGRELPIARAGRGEAVTRGELLEVLPARMRPFVEYGREHPCPGGGLGRGETRRTCADDDEIPARFRPPVRRRRNEGGRLAGGNGRRVFSMDVNLHAIAHAGHARPLRPAPVHRHQALVADPHAAEDPARVARPRRSKRGNARRGQGRGHRLPFDGRHRSAFEVDRDGRSRRNDSRGSKAKGAHGVASHRGLTVHRSAGGTGPDRRTGRPPCSLRSAMGVGVGPGRRRSFGSAPTRARRPVRREPNVGRRDGGRPGRGCSARQDRSRENQRPGGTCRRRVARARRDRGRRPGGSSGSRGNDLRRLGAKG